MQNRFPGVFIILLSLLQACAPAGKVNFSVSRDGMITAATRTDTLLEKLLSRYPSFFRSMLSKRDSLKLQIIYSQIDRDANNRPLFRDFYFNVNAANYFYPASSVKMPVAVLALERLNQLKYEGISRNNTMITESGYSGQTSVFNDPTAPDGRPTIAHYIKKIFLVSDNDAYNRLYEFLGQKYINLNLRRKGYKEAEIIHRLSIPLTEAENRHTNPLSFFDSSAHKLFDQPMQFNEKPLFNRNDYLGKAYYAGKELKTEPLNFSRKNRISLESLHFILRSIIFPDAVPAKLRFKIPDEAYTFLWQYMSQLPGESSFPPYDTTKFHDTYCKFLLFGSEQKTKMAENIRVFNKVGDAYGFMLDIAYIVDFNKKIEFMLSTVIYCNGDGILNDDKYDYDTVGFPFMKHLGEVIYEYETKRVRKFQPDLSGFRMRYE